MSPIAVIEAPSILGLRPTGVQEMPTALKAAGLLTAIKAEHSGRIEPTAPYNPQRDPHTSLLNGDGIREYSIALAGVLADVLNNDKFPVVIGGDCSILLGDLLALRRRGRYGLFFLDGHSDFYAPELSPTGEVADMDLALATGRGPESLSNLEGFKPLVREEDVVLFGYRDEQEAAAAGSEDPKNTAMSVFDLPIVRAMGALKAAHAGLAQLSSDLDGVWLHLDADVLDDAVMPAVDYRLEGGLQFAELSTVLSEVLTSGRVVGMEITIFNPVMDKTGEITRNFVQCLVNGFEEFCS